MKDTLIISMYDSCVGWSVFIDGYIIDREELEYPRHRYPNGIRLLAKEIYTKCDYGRKGLEEYLLKKFNNYYSIIICEDGGIEIVK